MTKRSTKQQLLLSAISLLLCVSMLVGSTFAWFTDSVTSTNNIIKSGNLDVELYYSNKDTNNVYEKVTSGTNIFLKDALWEPGYTEVVKLKVANEGTLALKYTLGINVASETEGKNVDGDMFKLSDYIYFGIVEGEQDYATRAEAVAAVKATAKPIKTGFDSETSKLVAPGTTGGVSEEYVTVVVYMPETVTNVANYRDKQPVINLGLNLFATQLEYEKDSFDETYDKDADFYPEWDGDEEAEVPAADADGVITITSAAELAALAADVNAGNTYAGKTVKLGTSINLGNQPWTPIGANGDKSGFQGTFDGQNYTIYNLKVEQTARAYQSAGLFGSARNATIKNFKIVNAEIVNLDDAGNTSNGAAVVVGAAQFATTIDNVDVESVKVTGNRRVAAIAGYYVGTITNCDVKDATLIANFDDMGNGSYDNADKIGTIIAYSNGNSTITNNTVEKATINGYRDIGGIAGYATTSTLADNKVKDVTILVNNEKNYKNYTALDEYDAEAIVGEGTADATNVAENVTVKMGKSVAPGVVEVAPKTYEIGTKEGLQNLSDVLSTVFAGEGVPAKVKLTANIDLENEPWTPINKMFVEFDGNGKTISNLTVDAWQAGLFGYLGGGVVKNLTLENVNITGAQAGAFAGALEGTIDNCILKGDNYITYTEKTQNGGNIETWGGIGAITGVAQRMTVNATIEAGATVTLNYNNIDTDAPYVNELTGYIATTNGAVVNNGTIKTIGTPVNYFVDASTAAELQDALDNAKATTTITLTSDITGDVVATQKTNVNVVIDGNGNKFNGVMTVFGAGNQGGAETIAIQNINFVAKAGADSCIVSPDRAKNNAYSYAHNVTVANCTFTDPDGVVNCAAIRHEDGGDSNWTVTKCTVDNTMHSLLQVNNVIGKLTLDECTVNSKNGANLNSSTNVEMTKCNFDVKGYAVRFGVSTGGNLGEAKNYLIKDSTLKSACDDGDAVIIIRASAVDANLTLTNTTLVGTTEISGNTSATTITRN